MSNNSQLGGLVLGNALLGDAGSGGGPSMSASPAVVRAGRNSIVIALTGISTTWGGGTTFVVTGAASKVSQSVTDGTHATVTLNATGGGGSITISDGTLSTPLTGAVASIVATPNPAGVATGVLVSLVGTVTDWSGVTPSFAVSSGPATGLASVTVVNDTTAHFTVDFTATGTVTFTDGLTSFSVTVALVRKITKLAPFYQSDTITAPVTAQLRRLVAGSWMNVGAAVTAVADGITNGYGARIGVVPDSNGGWDGVVRWSDSSGSPIVVDEEVYIGPDSGSGNRTITKLAPYLITDVLTLPVTAQVQQLVSGSWTNVGSPVTAVSTGLTNGLGVSLTITPDSQKRFDGIVIWADSQGTPLKVADEITLSPSNTGGINGSGILGML